MTVSITLREKTAKALPKNVRQSLQGAIIAVLSRKECEMTNLVWRLTYSPEETCKAIGLEGISQEHITIIRDELIYFYHYFHSSWNYGNQHRRNTLLEKELFRALQSNRYAYDTVIWKLNRLLEIAVYDKTAVPKALRCLCSTQEPSQYGGLRAIGFCTEEAQFLKGAANAIGRVLDQMVKN